MKTYKKATIVVDGLAFEIGEVTVASVVVTDVGFTVRVKRSEEEQRLELLEALRRADEEDPFED